jgi:hypothetical protein
VPVPPWPPLVPGPAPRRRFPAWVVGSAILTIVFLVGTLFASVLTRDAPTGSPDEYRFLARNFSGEPIRWNPCEPIHYVVNLADAPPGSMADVDESIERVSLATGIEFVYDGETDEMPQQRRDSYQPGRYGDEWAPVLIAWVDPDDSPISFSAEGHTAAGVASPQVPADGGDILVSGWVAINADDPNGPGFGWLGAQGPVVLHELGHVMGLDHVKVNGELMEGSGGGVTDFGPGDLEGLRILGRSSGCLTTPDPG